VSSSKIGIFAFTARLEKGKYGNFTYSAVGLPRKIVSKLPEGRLRTSGTINDVPFLLAIQFRRDGRRFLLFSKAICKAANIKVGDRVQISFNLVSLEIVELPEELAAVFAQDKDAKKIWDTFTTGQCRNLTIYVKSVKNIDSRIKRALDIAKKIKTRQLPFQIVKKKK
jgi:Bacteriocin-protection, YdeI or OmpD-Associated/Domain of unknown function (DUF1905)